MGNEDGHDENSKSSTFTCHLCNKSFEEVDQLGLHRRTHSRVLKKVIVKKRIRTWAPATTTRPNEPPSKTTCDPPVDLPVDPNNQTTGSLKSSSSFKYKAAHDDDDKQLEEVYTGLNATQNSTAEQKDTLEDEPNLDFYDALDDEPDSLLSNDVDSPDDDKSNDTGEVKKIENKVVENRHPRRKQRIEARQVQEVEDIRADEVECLGNYKKIANCSLSVALAMKAAKMRKVMAKKLLEDRRRLAILKAKGILKINGPLPPGPSPADNHEDPSTPPLSPPLDVGTVIEKSVKSQLSSYSHRKHKRRPGTPWNRQQLSQNDTPKIKEEVDEDKSIGRGRPRKKSKKSDDSAEAGAEEKVVNIVEVKVKEEEPTVSLRGRRRLKSTKYQDFCDPSALDDEQN